VSPVVHRMTFEKHISRGDVDIKAGERGAAEPIIVKMLIKPLHREALALGFSPVLPWKA
jgi:hypothetical protein